MQSPEVLGCKWWIWKSFRDKFSPESVDGGDGERHGGGHGSDHEDGDPHHPHDLILGGLQEDKKQLKASPLEYD